jgi:hypothetical protein
MRNDHRWIASAALAVSLVGLQSPLVAHHGTNQSYDRSAPTTFKGVVTEFRYRNPHPALFLDVADDKGKTTRWTIEIAPTPYTLALRGWSQKRSTEALKAGTTVTVTVAPSVAGTPVGLLREIVGADGTKILGDLDGALRTGPE